MYCPKPAKGNSIWIFLCMLDTLCLKKSVFCLKSQSSLFPGPFPFSVLGQTTRLLLSFLAGPAFFCPSLLKGGSTVPAKYWQPLPQLPGAGTTQTLKLGGRNVRIQVSLLERETSAGSVFCFGLYCRFCFVKLIGGLASTGRWKRPPFQSSNLLQ